MKPSSAKKKGRRLQKEVAKAVRERFDLPDADVRSCSSGAGGVDVQLSAAARERFPFAVECKLRERLNVWNALEQAEANAGDLKPLLVFRRNRSPAYAAMRLDDLLDLLERAS